MNHSKSPFLLLLNIVFNYLPQRPNTPTISSSRSVRQMHVKIGRLCLSNARVSITRCLIRILHGLQVTGVRVCVVGLCVFLLWWDIYVFDRPVCLFGLLKGCLKGFRVFFGWFRIVMCFLRLFK